MKNQTMADKLAQKTFNSAQFQRSWATHMQVFGPILEPAFAEDYQAKVHLCAALNLISKQQLQQGLDKLKKMRELCVTDADRAAFYFFVGVVYEMAGHTQEMIRFYSVANEFKHGFYLPHLKLAKVWLANYLYERAEKEYMAGISCFDGKELEMAECVVVSSAYNNLATCLMMMHRYEEAKEALAFSREIYPNSPGRGATEALLHAIEGNAGRAKTSLNKLMAHAPEAYESVKKQIDGILKCEDPFFFSVPVDEDKIKDFWEWFEENEPDLCEDMDTMDAETALEPISEKLLETFPFLERPAFLSLKKNDDAIILELRDLYAVGIADAYEKLLAARPESITEDLQFLIVH